jgi:hypothetical protein
MSHECCWLGRAGANIRARLALLSLRGKHMAGCQGSDSVGLLLCPFSNNLSFLVYTQFESIFLVVFRSASFYFGFSLGCQRVRQPLGGLIVLIV